MAKMTLSGLTDFVKTYVTAAKQAAAWTKTSNNLLGLIDKVGEQITLDGAFQDKLPELDGNDLPLGKTIEEWFIDLTLPTQFVEPTDENFNPADTLKPYFPTVQDVSYSYTLGKFTVATSEPYNNIERAALTEANAANMTGKIIQRLTDSFSLYKYAQKKQLLANMIEKAGDDADLVTTIAIPTDGTTAEAFIKQVKMNVEDASFASENTSLGKSLIGAAPSLVLYIKKGVMPVVEVDALAGAFHQERLAVPAEIKVVDDFGDDDSGAYAMLIDPRGVKLHRGYHAIRNQENAKGDFISFFDQSENTGFISKNTYCHIYKAAE